MKIYGIYTYEIKMLSVLIVILFALIPHILCAQGGKDYGQFAPADAYLYDSVFAYYGSENEWSRRMFTEERGNTQYKRRGQRQMLAIQEGDADLAVEYCLKRLEQDPDDSEVLYMLVVAYSQLDEMEQAMIALEQALKAGLPLPLYEHEEFQQFASLYQIQLIHGPMLGAVSDNSVRIWCRLLQEDTLTAIIYENEDMSERIATVTGIANSARDFTVILEITNLEPDTKYYYDLYIKGRSIRSPKNLSFRTYPAAEEAATFKIAFGGGAGFTPQHESIWDQIALHKLSAFLFLGDNVYIDVPQLPGAVHSYTYYRRQSRPEYRRLVRNTPIYAIWDDHDCAIDDIWMGPYRDQPDWKYPTWELFRNNWNNPAYGSREWPGCWFNFSIADVDFFMLDGRFYRTNPFAAAKTMLGPEQKSWLLRSLKKSDATFKVLISPVPWTEGAKPGSRDTWSGYQEEREEIFTFITQNNINGVILISADRHRSDAWQIKRINGYDLYEFESSRLTNLHTHQVMPGALFGYNEECSFGVLYFDTTLKDPTVRYEIININGESIESLEVQLSELVKR
jgi:alkaline phosphatase D